MSEPPRDQDATQRLVRSEPTPAPAPGPAAAESTLAIPVADTVPMRVPDTAFTPPPELPDPLLELPAPPPPPPPPSLPELPALPAPEPPASTSRPVAPPHGAVAVGEARAQAAHLSPVPFLAVLALAVLAVLALFALLGGRGEGGGVEPAAVSAARGAAPAPAPVEELVVVKFRDRQGELAVTTAERVHGLEGVDPVVQRRLSRALTAGELALPEDLAVLGGGAGTAGTAALAPLAPAGTRVPDERPILRWRPAAEGASYVVTVADASGQPLAVSPALRAEEWRPPRALPRRRTLAWWVETRPRGRGAEPERSAPARFSVLAPEDVAFVERELTAGGGSRLAAAVLWAEVGALEEARAAAAELAAANPASPEIRRLNERLAAAGGS